MPYLELSLTCRESEQPRYEAALQDIGALSVTLLDAEAETPNERAILEPGVGETPLWQTLQLNALFAHGTDQRAILAALESFDGELELGNAQFREVEDQDWERVWMDQFKPMQFGRRLWIYPWTIEPEGLAEDAVVVRLDPGLAFGSGTHPTTALCLEWLEAQSLHGQTVLDFGCGSGILAIAALKLGAQSALGIDNDPQALQASADNAERNGVAGALQLALPAAAGNATYPIVVANILAGALDQLAETLAMHCAPAGRIALSGILKGQESELLQRYARWFDDLQVSVREDWVRIDGRRRLDAEQTTNA